MGLPSTVIRKENGTFRKHPSNRNLKTPALLKQFENTAFWKTMRSRNPVICLSRSVSKRNPKCTAIVAFLNFHRSVEEKHLMRFQSKETPDSLALREWGVARAFHAEKSFFSDSRNLAEEH